MVRLAGPGAPVRTPGGEPKRVAKGGVEPEGDLWAVKVAPNKSLTFLFKFRPQVNPQPQPMMMMQMLLVRVACTVSTLWTVF